jgi:hypothetical protein
LVHLDTRKRANPNTQNRGDSRTVRRLSHAQCRSSNFVGCCRRRNPGGCCASWRGAAWPIEHAVYTITVLRAERHSQILRRSEKTCNYWRALAMSERRAYTSVKDVGNVKNPLFFRGVDMQEVADSSSAAPTS